MMLKKEHKEVRKYVNFRDGHKDETFIKYESTLSVQGKTDKAIRVKVDVATTVLKHNFYYWGSGERPALFTWDETSHRSAIIWIPLSCIDGDPEGESLDVRDWIIKKNELLFYLTLYAERGQQHQRSYNVYSIKEIEAFVARANAKPRRI